MKFNKSSTCLLAGSLFNTNSVGVYFLDHPVYPEDPQWVRMRVWSKLRTKTTHRAPSAAKVKYRDLQWRRNEFESGGTRPRRQLFFLCPSTFLALKAQLVVLVSAFVMVSTVWSVFCLLFFYSRCPRALWNRCHWRPTDRNVRQQQRKRCLVVTVNG